MPKSFDGYWNVEFDRGDLECWLIEDGRAFYILEDGSKINFDYLGTVASIIVGRLRPSTWLPPGVSVNPAQDAEPGYGKYAGFWNDAECPKGPFCYFVSEGRVWFVEGDGRIVPSVVSYEQAKGNIESGEWVDTDRVLGTFDRDGNGFNDGDLYGSDFETPSVDAAKLASLLADTTYAY